MGAEGKHGGAEPGKLGHRWKPGQSGNPAGRAKDLVHVRDLARKYTQEAVKTLVEVMKQPLGKDNGRAKALAATALLDRGWGRPLQEISGPNGGPIPIDYSRLSPDELLAVRTKLAEVQAVLVAAGSAAAAEGLATPETEES